MLFPLHTREGAYANPGAMKKLLWTLPVILVGCSKPVPQAAQPTPEPQIVYVVVTPTAKPADEIAASPIAEFQRSPEPVPPVRPMAYEIPKARAALVPTVPAKEQPYCVIEDFLVRQPDSIGSIWFDGEVHNLGAQPASVKILVKAYSINEVLLDSKSFWPQPMSIPSGGKAHFNNYVESKRGEVRKVIPEILPQ